MANSGGIDFDFSQVNILAADMGNAPKEVIPAVRKAVERTAYRIRTDWRDSAREQNGIRGHAKAYPFSIDYDMDLDTDGEIGARIGPNRDRGRQAELQTILEDARGGVRSAPQRNDERAIRNNLADFERGLLIATEGKL